MNPEADAPPCTVTAAADVLPGRPKIETKATEAASTYRGPRVELLVIPDCPHATLAETLLRVTLNQLGLPHVPVLTEVINTAGEAVRRGFTGSPSIFINGIDPWAQPEGEFALACRLYPAWTRMPTQNSLAQALCAAVLDDLGRPGRRNPLGV